MNPNLEMQVNTTEAGLYTVTYGYKEALLDVQEAAFAVHGLGMVSPAQLGFLRAKNSGIFSPYSRTGADVLYDDRTNQVVMVPDGAISRLVGIANIVNAHRQTKEYVIPEGDQRELVYAMVDGMLNSDIAFIAPDGQTQVPTSEFGKNDLTSRLFSDKSLEIEAQEYGNWLQSKGRNVNTFFIDTKDYSRAQKALYLNKLRVYGPGYGFGVGGDLTCLNDHLGAFGVRFEKTAVGGAKK